MLKYYFWHEAIVQSREILENQFLVHLDLIFSSNDIESNCVKSLGLNFVLIVSAMNNFITDNGQVINEDIFTITHFCSTELLIPT